MSISEHSKRLLSTFMGLIMTFFKMYGMILALVSVAIVFDVITGVVASKANNVKITSKRAYKGFWKKVGLVLALFFGVLLDTFIPACLSYVSIEVPFNMPFGLIFGCYIVFNESISICENLFKINPTILPKWVLNMLKEGTEKIDNKKGGNQNE